MAILTMSLRTEQIQALLDEKRQAIVCGNIPFVSFGIGDKVELWATEDLDKGKSREGGQGACFNVFQSLRIYIQDLESLKFEGLDVASPTDLLFGMSLEDFSSYWDECYAGYGPFWSDNPSVILLILDEPIQPYKSMICLSKSSGAPDVNIHVSVDFESTFSQSDE